MKQTQLTPGIITEFFDKSEFAHMDLETKKHFLRGLIRRIIEQNPNGLTANEVAYALANLPIEMVDPHLDYLEATHEIFIKEVDGLQKYVAGMHLLNIIETYTRKIGNKDYSLTEFKNEEGHFILIQRIIETNGYRDVKSGLLIPANKIDDFIEALLDVHTKTKKPEYDDFCRGGGV